MHLIKTIKKNASAALANHWGSALAIFFLLAAFYLLFSIADAIMTHVLGVTLFLDVAGTPGIVLDDVLSLSAPSLLSGGAVFAVSFVVMSPLLLGTVRWFFKLGEGDPKPSYDILYYYSSFRLFFRSVGTAVHFGGRMIASLIVCTVPGAVILTVGQLLRSNADGNIFSIIAIISMVIGALLLGGGILLCIVWVMRYFLAPFLIAEDDGAAVARCFRQSAGAMKGNRGMIGLLIGSMSLQLVLCTLILPLLYVAPMLCASLAIASKYIMEKDKRQEETE